MRKSVRHTSDKHQGKHIVCDKWFLLLVKFAVVETKTIKLQYFIMIFLSSVVVVNTEYYNAIYILRLHFIELTNNKPNFYSIH